MWDEGSQPGLAAGACLVWAEVCPERGLEKGGRNPAAKICATFECRSQGNASNNTRRADRGIAQKPLHIQIQQNDIPDSVAEEVVEEERVAGVSGASERADRTVGSPRA